MAMIADFSRFLFSGGTRLDISKLDADSTQ
jgi:hypothetical protein